MGGTTGARAGRGSRWAKALDRHLGILLVLFLPLVRRRRAPPRQLRRIALVKSAAIGDSILLLPVIQAIIAAVPQAEVRVFLGASNRPVGAFLPAGVTCDLPISRPWAAVRTLRAFRPDLIIDFEPWARVSALVCALPGAWCIGFRTPGQHRHHGFDATVAHRGTVHEITNYRSLVRLLGIRSQALPSLQAAAPSPYRAVDPYLVIHPWSGGFRGEIKEWPEAHWLELCERGIAAGVRILVSGSLADAARAEHLARLVDRPGRCSSIAGRHGLAEMVSILREACCVISVNTGVMHLAAAAGARVIALNGPVDPRRWGALGPRSINVAAPLAGCGFISLGFEYAGNRSDCMQAISVAQVWSQLEPLLATGAAPGAARPGAMVLPT